MDGYKHKHEELKEHVSVYVQMLQFDRIQNSMQHTSPETDQVAARSKATGTLEPEPTQHNSLDRLQIRK